MKKLLIIISIACIFLSCEKGPVNLKPPSNIKIAVEGRDMAVTWKAVKNAQGYMIVLTSEDCGSGNRTADTRAGTAVATSNGHPAPNVTITGKTSLHLKLMAATDDPTAAMASAVTAKIMSLGGTSGSKEYLDSDYSDVARLEL